MEAQEGGLPRISQKRVTRVTCEEAMFAGFYFLENLFSSSTATVALGRIVSPWTTIIQT